MSADVNIPAELPCLLHAAVGEYRPGVQAGRLCVECVRLRPPVQGDPRAPIPPELREAAGMAAHVAFRAEHTAPDGGALGPPGAVYLHRPDLPHGPNVTSPCGSCDERMRDWPDLTEAQREAFRASQDAGMSVVWPVLRDAAPLMRDQHNRAPTEASCGCGKCDWLRRLAALGIK